MEEMLAGNKVSSHTITLHRDDEDDTLCRTVSLKEMTFCSAAAANTGNSRISAAECNVPIHGFS